MKPLFWMFGAWAVASLLLIGFWIAGSVVVVDKTGEVASAVATTGSYEQPLWHLPGGFFVGIPRLEGTIEVRCRDGTSRQMGYVTGHMHTWVKVVGDVPCAHVVEIR